MATIAEINAGSSYTGDPALGGGFTPATAIDTKPLENLAYYTMAYNKSVWDQNQKDTDLKIKELADLSDIRLNDLRGKDKEQATKEFADLQKYAADYARKIPKTPQEKMQNELEWQTKFGAFKNNYGSGKTRAIAYEKQLNDINGNANLTPQQKDVALKELNKKFDSTDIATPISAMDDFKVEKIDIPAPALTKVQTVKIGANEFATTEGSIYNPKVNSALADAIVLGIRKAYPTKGSPEYNALSEKQKLEADYQSSVDSQGKNWADSADVLNSVLLAKGADGKLLYINEDGSFNHQKFKDDNYANSTVMNAYDAAVKLDSYSRENKKQAQDPQGVFTDNGVGFKLRTPLNPEDFNYGIIDFSKGVTASQLVQSGIFAKHSGNTFEAKLTETDNAIQREKNAIDWAELGLKKKEFGLKQKQFEAAQTGTQTQINGAMERAKRIYGDLKKLADENGVISPDKLRQLNTEQLKYMGIEVPQERDPQSGAIINSGGFKPLDLSGDNQYAIQLVDGEIKVLAPKKGQTKLEKVGNRFVGEFDNTKSTTVFNVATNVLNEELTKAGSKELNSYWGVDVTGNATNFTDTKSSSVKSSTQSVQLSTDPADWKQEGSNWRYKDGSLYDSKGNKIK